MLTYYNENDKFAAAWLRELIRHGHISDGFIDERSIEDVHPRDLSPFGRCHFFAGIGGWDYALQLAGWPIDRPIWTGSCPCQPFSSAGRGRGVFDKRHLWPAFAHLIRECRPDFVAGEQVASPDGRAWLDSVLSDLEAAGFTVAAANLAAAGIGAPHIRQRLYWMAITERHRCEQPTISIRPGGPFPPAPDDGGIDHWRACDWNPCADGTFRPSQPGTFPLADGIPSRVVQLRGYGNAIVPQIAATFIQAFLLTELE